MGLLHWAEPYGDPLAIHLGVEDEPISNANAVQPSYRTLSLAIYLWPPERGYDARRGLADCACAHMIRRITTFTTTNLFK